jgi:intracellular proteinase inhibitor BsuPI/copper amine oxidase-like protein
MGHLPAWTLAALVIGVAPAGAVAPVRVVYDGHVINTPAPVVQSARGTLVPLRPVVTALGGQIRWDEASRVAVVVYRGHRLEVSEAAHALRLDGQPLRGALVPRTARGQLLVPLAAVERLFSVRGQWLPGRHRLSFAALRKPAAVIGRAASGVVRPPAADTRQATAGSGLLLTLTADRKTYSVGAPVRLSMSISNPARTTIALQFSSGQHYDFEVRRGRETIWRWSAGRMFTQALTTLTVGPGERRVYSETWNQRDNNGQPVPAGTYTAIATLTTMTRPQPQSQPLTLRIGG